MSGSISHCRLKSLPGNYISFITFTLAFISAFTFILRIKQIKVIMLFNAIPSQVAILLIFAHSSEFTFILRIKGIKVIMLLKATSSWVATKAAVFRTFTHASAFAFLLWIKG